MNEYDLLLDLYPLLGSFPDEGALLALRIEQCAFDLMDREAEVGELRTLLRMARDLGYLDDRIHVFLEKRLATL